MTGPTSTGGGLAAFLIGLVVSVGGLFANQEKLVGGGRRRGARVGGDITFFAGFLLAGGAAYLALCRSKIAAEEV